MRPDLGLSKEAIKSCIKQKASDPKRLLSQLPDLVRTTRSIATFKAGDKRKTTPPAPIPPEGLLRQSHRQHLHPVD